MENVDTSLTSEASFTSETSFWGRLEKHKKKGRQLTAHPIVRDPGSSLQVRLPLLLDFRPRVFQRHDAVEYRLPGF